MAGSVRAVGLTEHYRQIFEITRLSDYMAITDDEPVGVPTVADHWRSKRMTAMTILVDQAGDAGILRIAGDITSGSEPELMKAYTQASDAGATAIVLDFSGLEYMNSGGIGLLVTLLVRAQRAGQRLMAVGLSEHYRQILSLTRLDEAIEIHDDEAAALAAVDGLS